MLRQVSRETLGGGGGAGGGVLWGEGGLPVAILEDDLFVGQPAALVEQAVLGALQVSH